MRRKLTNSGSYSRAYGQLRDPRRTTASFETEGLTQQSTERRIRLHAGSPDHLYSITTRLL